MDGRLKQSGLEKLGKYVIESVLGSGAMADVYKAFDSVIERTVALKTIRKEVLDRAESDMIFARFKREVQAAGRLVHPNIVSIYDYGEIDDTAFIAMEFVDGRDLKYYIERPESLDRDALVNIMTQLLDALSYSHRNGVIHRDIKPANILLTDEMQVKVTDFGIAHIESSSLTQEGTVMGTPNYMPPEQVKGQEVDESSDLFSSGVILYQFLTGRLPFDGDSIATIIHNVLNVDPLTPSDYDHSIPSQFDPVVKKALAKDPDKRFHTADEFSRAINAVVKVKAPAKAYSLDATVLRTELVVKKSIGRKKVVLPIVAVFFILTAIVAGKLIFFPTEKPERTVVEVKLEPETDKAAEEIPILRLGAFSARKTALQSLYRNLSPTVSQRHLRNLWKLKTGLHDETGEKPGLVRAVDTALNLTGLTTKIESGDCDLLLALGYDGPRIVLTVMDNIFGDERVEANKDVLDPDDEDFLPALKSRVMMAYCFQALYALNLSNPINDRKGAKLYLKGKSGNRFQVGDWINICLTPEQQTYCLLFTVGPEGMFQILPRLGAENNRVARGMSFCSGEMEIFPPAGNEMVFAIAVTQKQLLDDRHYRFSSSEPFHQWAYDSTKTQKQDDAATLCEQLFLSLLNQSKDKWRTDKLFIKTFRAR